MMDIVENLQVCMKWYFDFHFTPYFHFPVHQSKEKPEARWGFLHAELELNTRSCDSGDAGDNIQHRILTYWSEMCGCCRLWCREWSWSCDVCPLINSFAWSWWVIPHRDDVLARLQLCCGLSDEWWTNGAKTFTDLNLRRKWGTERPGFSTSSSHSQILLEAELSDQNALINFFFFKPKGI